MHYSSLVVDVVNIDHTKQAGIANAWFNVIYDVFYDNILSCLLIGIYCFFISMYNYRV